MSTHKYIERICAVATLVIIILSILFMNAEKFGIQPAAQAKEYEESLFDTSVVHTIDIEMDDWESFLETCTDEEYTICSVTIDGETLSNVAIRAKGNTSLSQVQNYGNDRYSFKIEFDHYDDSINYQGLDRLCLNNIIQDDTYMKDYLTYQMTNFFGVDAPLSSFAYITVNGEDWGLYVAVEDVSDSFLERNYGNDYGELYKPDSTGNMGGGGRAPGEQPENMQNMPSPPTENEDTASLTPPNASDTNIPSDNTDSSESAAPSESAGPFESTAPSESDDNSESSVSSGTADFLGTEDTAAANMQDFKREQGGRGGGMSSDDTLLVYTDDDYDSYSNIFDNAETDITDADKDRLIESLKQLNEGENIEEVVNIDEVIRYFVVHNFVCNFDSYTGSMIHNYYLYEEDGQLSMIPWDYNLAFGGFQGGSDATSMVNYPIDTPVSGLSVEERPMLAWIFADETHTQLYHAYFAEFISDFFDSGYFDQMMDDVYSLIAPYVEKDPTKFCTYEEFETGFETLRQFCTLRAESVNGQLNGTIPSTSEGQQEDSSNLVDASFISISDMGNMNMGNMGNKGSKGGDFRSETNTVTSSDSSDADLQIQSETAENTENIESTENTVSSRAFNTSFAAPDMSFESQPNSSSASDSQNITSEETADDSAVTAAEQSDTTSSAPGTTENSVTNGRSTQMQPSETSPSADSARTGSFPTDTQSSSSTVIIIAASLIALAVGIIIAALYKR